MKKCSQCGAMASENAGFCPNCAFAFKEPEVYSKAARSQVPSQFRICGGCGSTMRSDAKFCHVCGTAGRPETLKRDEIIRPSLQEVNGPIGSVDNAGGLPEVPSDPLLGKRANFPWSAIAIGIFASLGLGFALFIASRIAYIYILYNSIIGTGIGAAIGYGLVQGKYRMPRLHCLILVALCSLLAYLSYNFSLLAYAVSQVSTQKFGILDLLIGSIGFLVVRAEEERPFGIRLGAVGNYVLWVIEYSITLSAAWSTVRLRASAMDG